MTDEKPVVIVDRSYLKALLRIAPKEDIRYYLNAIYTVPQPPTSAQPAASAEPCSDTRHHERYLAGWNDCRSAMLASALTPPTYGQAQQVADLKAIYDAFGIGSAARELHILLECIGNVKRRSECLGAIERTFFMVPGEPDEDFPDEAPDDECLLRWGSDVPEYVEQFRSALDRIRPSSAQQDADKVGAQPVAWSH